MRTLMRVPRDGRRFRELVDGRFDVPERDVTLGEPRMSRSASLIVILELEEVVVLGYGLSTLVLAEASGTV